MTQRNREPVSTVKYPYLVAEGRSPWLCYLVAILATGAALAVTRLLPDYSINPTYFFFLGAISVSTWFGGVLPGAVSMLLSGLVIANMATHLPGLRSPQNEFIRYLAWFATAFLTWYVTAAMQRAREALLRSNLRFGGVVQISEDAIICIDQGQRITLFNPGAEKIFGYSAQEVIGQPINILLPQRFRDAHEQHVRSFGSSADALRPMNQRGTIYGRRKNGAEFPAEASISKFEMGGEKILTVRLRDISERQLAEDNLRKLAAIVESSHDAIIGKTLEGVITSWNRGAERIYGYSAAEAIGKNIAMLSAPERAGEIEGLLERLRRGEGVDEYETLRVCKDGGLIDVSLTISPIRNSEGGVVGAAAIARDVTDRKRAEKELAESISLMRATLESTADGILVVDRQSQVISYNRKFAQMWRIPESVLQAGSKTGAQEFVREQLKDPDGFVGRVREIYATPESESYDVLEFKDGRVFERYSQPQRVKGEIVGRVWSFRDISDRRRLEQQLRQAQKMEAVGRLAGGVAHDFNNLLNVIVGYTYLTLSRLNPGDPLRGNVEQVVQATERATALTRQLLAFSRKQVLHLEVLDLNEVVGGMGKMLPRLIGEDVDVRIVTDNALGRVKADAGQIEQVIMNLVINARDAMPAGGKLTLETANVYLNEAYARQHALQAGEYVMLAVSDTGHGMDAETRTHIFEPFFTTKEAGKGTGLGLATVYGIINQVGGHIWVYSEPDHGTTFKIYLPLVEEAAARPRPAKILEAGLQGWETVLLVEDETSMRKLLVEVLTDRGYKVLDAPDGKAALQIAGDYEGPIGLLLTDVVMPGMRGQHLAERVMQSRPEMKVIFMSGYTDKALVHHGSLQPDTILLQKPFSPDVLLRKVREVLGPAAAAQLKKAG